MALNTKCHVIICCYFTDPCATTNYLNDWRRSVAFEVDSTNKLCDNILEAGWYRITSGQGDRMPTECVEGGFRCNTGVPIWLSNGKRYSVKSRRSCLYFGFSHNYNE